MFRTILITIFFFFFLGILVRKKWKRLRDKFRMTLASIPKSKSGDVQISDYQGEWKYFKSLLFLKEQFTKKPEGYFPKNDDNVFAESSQNLQDDSDDNESEQAVKDEPVQSPAENSDSEMSNTTPSSFLHLSSGRKRPMENLEFTQQKKSKKEEEEDEDLNFFKSLLPHVRSLSAYDKMEYRMKIIKLTQEFLKP